MNEVWAVVPSADRYEVSNLGRVRRVESGRVLKAWRAGSRREYDYVHLSQGGRGLKTAVHRLVAAAFVRGHRPGLEVAHLDGNPQNNRAENLRWVTHRENEKQKVSHGTATYHQLVRRGSEHHRAKINEADAVLIRQSRKKAAAVAAEFRISESTVRRIRAGALWSHAG